MKFYIKLVSLICVLTSSLYADDYDYYARNFDCIKTNTNNGLSLICKDNNDVRYDLTFSGAYQPYREYVSNNFSVSCKVQNIFNIFEKNQAFAFMDQGVQEGRYHLIDENNELKFVINYQNITSLCVLLFDGTQAIPFNTYMHKQSFDYEDIKFSLQIKHDAETDDETSNSLNFFSMKQRNNAGLLSDSGFTSKAEIEGLSQDILHFTNNNRIKVCLDKLLHTYFMPIHCYPAMSAVTDNYLSEEPDDEPIKRFEQYLKKYIRLHFNHEKKNILADYPNQDKAYKRFLTRVRNTDSKNWFDIADEEGILLSPRGHFDGPQTLVVKVNSETVVKIAIDNDEDSLASKEERLWGQIAGLELIHSMPFSKNHYDVYFPMISGQYQENIFVAQLYMDYKDYPLLEYVFEQQLAYKKAIPEMMESITNYYRENMQSEVNSFGLSLDINTGNCVYIGDLNILENFASLVFNPGETMLNNDNLESFLENLLYKTKVKSIATGAFLSEAEAKEVLRKMFVEIREIGFLQAEKNFKNQYILEKGDFRSEVVGILEYLEFLPSENFSKNGKHLLDYIVNHLLWFDFVDY